MEIGNFKFTDDEKNEVIAVYNLGEKEKNLFEEIKKRVGSKVVEKEKELG